jgi:hypothetical protein
VKVYEAIGRTQENIIRRAFNAPYRSRRTK